MGLLHARMEHISACAHQPAHATHSVARAASRAAMCQDRTEHALRLLCRSVSRARSAVQLTSCAQAAVRLTKDQNRVVEQLQALSAIMLSRTGAGPAECTQSAHARLGLELRAEQLATVLHSEGEQLSALEVEVRRLGQSHVGPEVVDRVCEVSTLLRNEARPVRAALKRAIRSIEACCVLSEELVLLTLQSLASMQHTP
jgi:hypothetical protein